MRLCIPRSSLALSALLLVFLVMPRAVRANGVELLPGGTQSVSRGGAVAARPENALALEHNPAGMALLSSDQLLLNIDVPIHDMCVDPYGYYGWGVYQPGDSEFGDPIVLDNPNKPTIGATYASSPLPKICNTGQVFGIPQMAWAGKITDDLAIGAGFVAPTLITGLQWGGPDGTIDTEFGARPTPTRYQIVRQQVKFAFAPTVGVGYSIIPQLQVGATATLAMIDAVTRVLQNATSGTQPSTDWLADVEAHDYFIPAITASVNAKPIPQLDVMASFRWVDSFDGSGKVTYTTNYFHENAPSGPIPFKNDPIKLSRVLLRVPWTATVGVRYAGLLAPRADETEHKGLGDPMDRELWDVEVDASYNFNKRADLSRVEAGQDVTLITRERGGGGDAQTQKLEDLSQLNVTRHLRDSIAVRAGGSFSIVPRKVALEAGAFFENRAIDLAYASVDSFAFNRFGFGFGGMVRVGDFDLMAGYSHIFSETVDLAPPNHQVVQAHKKNDPTSGFDQRVGVNFDNNDRNEGYVLKDPAAPSAANADAVARLQQSAVVPSPARPERVINAGKYTAAFNIISIGAIYHF